MHLSRMLRCLSWFEKSKESTFSSWRMLNELNGNNTVQFLWGWMSGRRRSDGIKLQGEIYNDGTSFIVGLKIKLRLWRVSQVQNTYYSNLVLLLCLSSSFIALVFQRTVPTSLLNCIILWLCITVYFVVQIRTVFLAALYSIKFIFGTAILTIDRRR